VLGDRAGVEQVLEEQMLAPAGIGLAPQRTHRRAEVVRDHHRLVALARSSSVFSLALASARIDIGSWQG
jgi:hypothetical protein